MRRRTTGFVLVGLGVALVLALGVSRLASSQPDGLERVAADHGIDADEQDHGLAEGPFADYATSGVDDEGLSTGVAGVVGVAATFAVAWGLVLLLGGRREARGATNPRRHPEHEVSPG